MSHPYMHCSRSSGVRVADTACRSDDNELLCRSENIVLVSPTAGKCSTEHTDPAAITMANFRSEDRLESFLSGFQPFTVA